MRLATFLLQDNAKDWLTLHAAKAGGEGIVAWEEFRKAFKDKFYPHSFCDAKRNKLMNLVKGELTVAGYEKQFTELAKYALAFVVDETDKCKRFEEGLQTEIIALVTTSMDLFHFSKLVEAAMRVERCMEVDKKNKISKKDPCGQSFGSMRSNERRGEKERFAL